MYVYIAVFSDFELNIWMKYGIWVFEVFFMIDILKCFITDFTPVGEVKPIRDFKSIAIHYLKTNFIVDLILWMPIAPMLSELTKEITRIYIIKCFRLFKVLAIFNVNKIITSLKERQRKQLSQLVISDIESEQEITIDYNRISFHLYAGYSLQILKLIVNMTNIAFFLGSIRIIYDSFFSYYLLRTASDLKTLDNFYDVFDIHINSIRTIIIIMYYNFSTMAKIGLGDYYPLNDTERIYAVLLFLIGNTVFT